MEEREGGLLAQYSLYIYENFLGSFLILDELPLNGFERRQAWMAKTEG
jgi:hypothetical protein